MKKVLLTLIMLAIIVIAVAVPIKISIDGEGLITSTIRQYFRDSPRYDVVPASKAEWRIHIDRIEPEGKAEGLLAYSYIILLKDTKCGLWVYTASNLVTVGTDYLKQAAENAFTKIDDFLSE